ncbi:hypothetical protein MCEMRH37_01252 [Candidatus Nanopelagicaceae bacterium]
MEILKFDGGKPSKNRNKLVTVIAGAFLVAVVGSTFAANITINTNNSLEYGQGLTQAAACDSSMNIAPTNFYVNGTNSAGSFYLDTITVTDAATTSSSTGLGKCINKNLKISAWDSVTASSALVSCIVTPSGYTTTLAGSVSSCGTGVYTALATGFSISYPAPASAPAKLAGDVYKITIESN